MDDEHTSPLVYVWGAWSENMMVPVPLVSMNDLKFGSEGSIDIDTIVPVDTLTFIIDKMNRLWVWGYDGHGRLGLGSDVDHVPKPTLVRLVPETGKDNGKGIVSQISVGNSHVLALTENGDVYAWGENYFGQMGTQPSEKGKPVKVPIGGAKEKRASQVLCVKDSSFALCEDSVYAWGFNEDGNLGLNHLIPTELPTKIPTFEDVCVIKLVESGQRVYAIVKSTLSDSDEENAGNPDDFYMEEIKVNTVPEAVVPEKQPIAPVKGPQIISKVASMQFNTSAREHGSKDVSLNTSKRTARRSNDDFVMIEKSYGLYKENYEEVKNIHKKLLTFDTNLDDYVFRSGPKPGNLKTKLKINELSGLADNIYSRAEKIESEDTNSVDAIVSSSIHTELRMLKEGLTLRKVMLLFAQMGSYFDYLKVNSFIEKSKDIRDKNFQVSPEDIKYYCETSISKVVEKMNSLKNDFETLHYGEDNFFSYIFDTLHNAVDMSCTLWTECNKQQYDALEKESQLINREIVDNKANEIWKCISKLQGAKLHRLKEVYVKNENHSSFEDYMIDLFDKSDKRIRGVESQMKGLAKKYGREYSDILKKLHKLAVENIELLKLANEANRAALQLGSDS
mmetsp:Transcript_6378/g.11105  ORF Transcript_6378/g.11105 Transcript_6378/m.11105 type:complete len:620 (+) Transcript_6378:877-2736(+)